MLLQNNLNPLFLAYLNNFTFAISESFARVGVGIRTRSGYPPPPAHTQTAARMQVPPPPQQQTGMSHVTSEPLPGRGHTGGGTRAGVHGRGYTGGGTRAGVHGRGYTGGGTREGVTVRSNGKLRCAISPWLLVRQGNTYIYIKCRICIRSLLFYKALYTKLHECHLDTVCHQTHGFCIFLFAHMNNTYTPTVFPSLREYHPDKTEKIPLPYKKMRLPAWK